MAQLHGCRPIVRSRLGSRGVTVSTEVGGGRYGVNRDDGEVEAGEGFTRCPVGRRRGWSRC